MRLKTGKDSEKTKKTILVIWKEFKNIQINKYT